MFCDLFAAAARRMLAAAAFFKFANFLIPDIILKLI